MQDPQDFGNVRSLVGPLADQRHVAWEPLAIELVLASLRQLISGRQLTYGIAESAPLWLGEAYPATPYNERLRAATSSYNQFPDSGRPIKLTSYIDGPGKRLCDALARQLPMEVTSAGSRPVSAEDLPAQGLAMAALSAQEPNRGLHRRAVSATAMMGQGGWLMYTDWTYTADVIRDGVSEYRIFTTSDSELDLEGIDASIVSAQPLGLSRTGSQIWRVVFPRAYNKGERVTWSIRKSPIEALAPEPDTWLSYATGIKVLASANFTLAFDKDAPVPRQVIRTSTEKGRFKPSQKSAFAGDVQRDSDGCFRTSFHDLETHRSYGLQWTW